MFLYSLKFSEHCYDHYFKFFIRQITNNHFISGFSLLFFHREHSLLSPHFIWLPVFLLVKWNKYLFQSWRRALCRSDFCVDYMCWVALASWLELKSVHAVPEVPWQNYWQGLEQAQGRVSQGCCSRGPMAGQLAGAGAGVGTGWGGPGYGVITVQEG